MTSIIISDRLSLITKRKANNLCSRHRRCRIPPEDPSRRRGIRSFLEPGWQSGNVDHLGLSFGIPIDGSNAFVNILIHFRKKLCQPVARPYPQESSARILLQIKVIASIVLGHHLRFEFTVFGQIIRIGWT